MLFWKGEFISSQNLLLELRNYDENMKTAAQGVTAASAAASATSIAKVGKVGAKIGEYESSQMGVIPVGLHFGVDV